MDTIFTLGEEGHENVKLNIDELYEHKRQSNLNTLALYNRILSRVHHKIKTSARVNKNQPFTWFLMPEMIVGVPKFDHLECIAYVIDQLRDNGFMVKYTHPNLLLISWANYVPSYVRQEIKKKLNKVVDEFGNEVVDAKNAGPKRMQDMSFDEMTMMLSTEDPTSTADNPTPAASKTTKEYKPINSYKPSGLIYNENLLKSIEDKTR
jgi:hypothetical protein